MPMSSKARRAVWVEVDDVHYGYAEMTNNRDMVIRHRTAVGLHEVAPPTQLRGYAPEGR